MWHRLSSGTSTISLRGVADLKMRRDDGSQEQGTLPPRPKDLGKDFFLLRQLASGCRIVLLNTSFLASSPEELHMATAIHFRSARPSTQKVAAGSPPRLRMWEAELRSKALLERDFSDIAGQPETGNDAEDPKTLNLMSNAQESAVSAICTLGLLGMLGYASLAVPVVLAMQFFTALTRLGSTDVLRMLGGMP